MSCTIKVFSQKLTRVEILLLCWSLHSDKIPADGFFSKNFCIVWSFVLGHLFVKGENCLQSSSIHRVRHDVANTVKILSILFEEVIAFPFTVFDRWCFLLSNANPLNLAPSVHSRCFIPSPVLCLCSFAHLNLFPLVPDVAFSFHFCREARIVEFPLYCRCWDWGFVDTV